MRRKRLMLDSGNSGMQSMASADDKTGMLKVSGR